MNRKHVSRILVGLTFVTAVALVTARSMPAAPSPEPAQVRLLTAMSGQAAFDDGSVSTGELAIVADVFDGMTAEVVAAPVAPAEPPATYSVTYSSAGAPVQVAEQIQLGSASSVLRTGDSFDDNGAGVHAALGDVDVMSFGLRPAALLDDVIETQDFEGDFPPEGWSTYDGLARDGASPERYKWAIQSIDLPVTGGQRAPWSIGGGPVGASLGFGGTYTLPVSSLLTYGPVDTRAYPDGLTVQMQFKTDLPLRSGGPNNPSQAKTFLICATRNDSATDLDCRTLADEDGARNRWLRWQEPLLFNRSGGLEEATVYIVHRDLLPTGSHTGVIVDDVVIVGLSASDPSPDPTPTPGEGPSPTPTQDTDPGPGPVPATPDGRRVMLPITMKSFDVNTLPMDLDKPLPGTVTVDFGTEIDTATGRLEGHGIAFPLGIMQLCARSTWRQLPEGTPFRVQWYHRPPAGEFGELDPDNLTGINDEFEVSRDSGFAFQCITFADVSGELSPVPEGFFRVSVFLRQEASAAASETVAIRRDIPMPEPSGTPAGGTPVATQTPQPGPTPKPTLPAGCTDPIVNGDFELGPSVGWEQQSAANRASIRPEGALQSNYGVLFGTYPGAREAVVSQVRVDTFAPEEIESVTVFWWLRVVSQEDRSASNPDHSDNLFIGVRGETDNLEAFVRISEDSPAPGTTEPFPSDRWFSLQAVITDAFLARENFATAQLFFRGELNENELLTNFMIDNVRLEICMSSGELVRMPLTMRPTSAGTLPAGDGLPLVARTNR